MNHFKLKAAVKKYSELYSASPLDAKEAIELDNDPDEAAAIIAALQEIPMPLNESNGKEPAPPPTAVHSHYKWFDEFDARIQKKEILNPLLRKNESVITGWELQKKKHPKLIEPHIATQLNAFADGYDVLGIGNLLLPKGEYKTGDVIPYTDWAKEQGKNFAEDLNILLTKSAA